MGVNTEPVVNDDPEGRKSLNRKRKLSSDHDTLLSDYRLLCETVEYVHHDKDWTAEQREQWKLYSLKRKAQIVARLGNILIDMDYDPKSKA